MKKFLTLLLLTSLLASPYALAERPRKAQKQSTLAEHKSKTQKQSTENTDKQSTGSANPASQASSVRQRMPLFERSTWNAQDAMDDTPGYDRSMHVLEQTVSIPASWMQGDITFVALGANQEVWLEANGQEVGYHAGGYTAFSFLLTPYLHPGTNTLKARITNAHNPSIPPLSADFTFFGGFYRDAYLLYTPKQHFSTTFFASSGLCIRTPQVSADEATVHVSARLTGIEKGTRIDLLLDGRTVASTPLAAGAPMAETTFAVKNPRLWSPSTPHLYTLTARLIGKRGQLLDEVSEPLGLRWYSFDADGLFHLNGKPLRLIGTNRHQCAAGMGWAVTDSIHRQDIQAIKDMGGNFLRVSHYPQDPLLMHLCDSLGILCSVEIPVVNAITETDAFTQSCLQMAEEMVWQNRNHPSVVMWGYMNEVLLRPPFKYQKGQEARHQLYLRNVNALASQLDRRLHALDPERYTFAAIHDDLTEYAAAGLDTLADVIGHNIYSGWYSGTIESLDAKVARLHAARKGRPLLMSEYGADCDIRLRSATPEAFDYTIDYAMRFHRHYLHLLLTTRLFAGGTAWNLCDFHSESRGGAVPHLNLKGLITADRQPKATYYFYQSELLTDSSARAVARARLDSALQMPVPQPWPLCILLGAQRFFTDSLGHVWQPDKPYHEGSWGYIDGTAYHRHTWNGSLPASDVAILGTHEAPIYQTARMALSAFRFDVPDGRYQLTLRFAELETPGEQEMSPYNLGNKALDTGFTGRQQTIRVNGQLLVQGQRLATYQATELTTEVEARQGEGIVLQLSATEGATLLNALQLTPIP